MKTEPVAWRYKYEDDDTTWNYQDNKSLIKSMIRVHHIIAEPLYTHPAKTLTDEELLKQIRHAISCYFDDAYSYSDELYYKIKAILKRK